MQLLFDRFILGFPRLYIKQFPYAWIVLVVLWVWPPNISIIFLVIILLGLVLLHWQYRAWLRSMRNEHAPTGGKFYVDKPAMPLPETVKRILLLVALCGLAAYILRDQFNLTFWQILLINVGFLLMYKDALFFGAPVTYVITATGIAVYFAPGHLDYRLFFRFDEIGRIERRGYVKDQGWDDFSCIRNSPDGLLLIPRNPRGFSKRLQRLFIVPQDIDNFLEQLPYGFRPLET